tara:strand:- start:781 stop:1020 length:240 start_codon:yes stop_codon:yes gene_type:complete
MKITIEKMVKVTSELNTNEIDILFGGQRDVNSVNFEVYYEDIEIAYGHLNNVSNMAHVTIINEDNQDLEDYLVNRIENR